MSIHQPDETLDQRADRMNKAFIIRAYQLLLTRMLPQNSAESILEVAQLAEQAMTEVPELSMHEGLRDKTYALCPLSEANAKALHETLCRFAPNVIGALVQKGMEIVNGAYTGDDFINTVPIGG